MVKKRNSFEDTFVSIPVNTNQNNPNIIFRDMFNSFNLFILNLFLVAKEQSIFLCLFSCVVSFLLAWVVNSSLYFLFVAVFLFSLFHILNEAKLLLIKKDFDENGIF